MTPEPQKVTGHISHRTKMYPRKAADGKVYLFFNFDAPNLRMLGKRGGWVKFRAEAYATGSAWTDFKAQRIYPGKEVTLKGYFDPTLGDGYAFRVLEITWEDLTKYITVEPDFLTQQLEF